MKKLPDKGEKIYSGIELHTQFALNGKAYVMRLAMTDNPARLGTERLKFAAHQRKQVISFNNQQGEVSMFTDAIEAELIALAEQCSDEGKQWFSLVMGIISKGRKSDSKQFSQLREAVENVAQSHADLLDRFNVLSRARQQDRQIIQKLTVDLSALTSRLVSQDNSDSQRR